MGKDAKQANMKIRKSNLSFALSGLKFGDFV